MALQSTTINSKTTKSCYTALNLLGQHNSLEVRWIAAHTGLWGNEKADELAKLGTTEGTPITCPIPHSLIKRRINQKVQRLDNLEWSRNGHLHTKTTLGRKRTEIISQLNNCLGKDRKKYRIAAQLITGHCPLNKYLYTIRKVTSKACNDCGEAEETASHFLGQCPAKNLLRVDHFGDYYLSISEIFEKSHITTIVNYATKTGRFDIIEEQDNTGVT